MGKNPSHHRQQKGKAYCRFRTYVTIACLAIASLASAQPKRYVTAPLYNVQYSPAKASVVWVAKWELSIPDSFFFNMYQGNRVYWHDTSTTASEMIFSCDTIRGRGDKREVLITTITKDDSAKWWIWERYPAAWEMIADSIYWGKHTDSLGHTSYRRRCDTIMFPTPDSTYRQSEWLCNTPTDYWNKQVGWDAKGAPVVIGRRFWPKDTTQNTRALRWHAEKILGDPTKNGGKDQLVIMRWQYFVEQSDSVYALGRLGQ